MLLIYLAFYLHNRSVIEEAVYEAVCYGSTLNDSDKAYVLAQVEKKFETITKERLFAISDLRTNVDINTGKVQLSVHGEMKIPLFANLFRGFGRNTIIQAVGQSEFIYPKRIIWIANIIENTRRD